MKKILFLLLFLCLTATAHAQVMGSPMGAVQGAVLGGQNEAQRIETMFPIGLTFYKNYAFSNSGDKVSLNADYAIGSPVATYTSTSGVPTVSGGGYNATTANLDILRYAILGNRTAAQETIIISFTPSIDSTSLTANAYLTITDSLGGKQRDITISSAADDVFFRPNLTDSGSAILRTGVGLHPLAGVTYIISGVAISSAGNPNSAFYVDSTAYDSTTQANTDWTVPTWGAFFYIGCDATGANQAQGVLGKIAIFNRPLSANEELAVKGLM
jgi:hypothetical protein